jgi:hypothetical protein
VTNEREEAAKTNTSQNGDNRQGDFTSVRLELLQLPINHLNAFSHFRQLLLSSLYYTFAAQTHAALGVVDAERSGID